jgi:hypothetical protein
MHGQPRESTARGVTANFLRARVRGKDLQGSKTRLLQRSSFTCSCREQEFSPDTHPLRPARLRPCRMLFGQVVELRKTLFVKARKALQATRYRQGYRSSPVPLGIGRPDCAKPREVRSAMSIPAIGLALAEPC